MAKEKEKVRLHIGRVQGGLPTVEEIVALYSAITGREPTPEERAALERARAADLAKENRNGTTR